MTPFIMAGIEQEHNIYLDQLVAELGNYRAAYACGKRPVRPPLIHPLGQKVLVKGTVSPVYHNNIRVLAQQAESEPLTGYIAGVRRLTEGEYRGSGTAGDEMREITWRPYLMPWRVRQVYLVAIHMRLQVRCLPEDVAAL